MNVSANVTETAESDFRTEKIKMLLRCRHPRHNNTEIIIIFTRTAFTVHMERRLWLASIAQVLALLISIFFFLLSSFWENIFSSHFNCLKYSLPHYVRVRLTVRLVLFISFISTCRVLFIMSGAMFSAE